MSWEYMRNFMAQILILLTLRGLKLPRFDGNQASEWRKITWQISSIIETCHWYSSELVDLRWWIKELTILWFIITSHPPIWPFFFGWKLVKRSTFLPPFHHTNIRSLEPKIRRELANVRRKYQMQRAEAGFRWRGGGVVKKPWDFI